MKRFCSLIFTTIVVMLGCAQNAQAVEYRIINKDELIDRIANLNNDASKPIEIYIKNTELPFSSSWQPMQYIKSWGTYLNPWSFAKEHPYLTGALGLGGIGAYWYYRKRLAEQERLRAEQERLRAEQERLRAEQESQQKLVEEVEAEIKKLGLDTSQKLEKRIKEISDNVDNKHTNIINLLIDALELSKRYTELLQAPDKTPQDKLTQISINKKRAIDTANEEDTKIKNLKKKKQIYKQIYKQTLNKELQQKLKQMLINKKRLLELE